MKLILATIMLVVFFMNSSFADDTNNAQQPNGCGAKGIQGYLVPDSTLFTKCQFQNACNHHDVCYSRCLPGGDLEGQPTCDDEFAKLARKTSCDIVFYNTITEDNDDRFVCKVYAGIYKFAVVNFGTGNFFGKEVEALAFSISEKGEVEGTKIFNNLTRANLTNTHQKLQFTDGKIKILQQQKDFEYSLKQFKQSSPAYPSTPN